MREWKRLLLALSLIATVLFNQACGASTLSKLHDSLNKTAKALNAAAKTNRSFYESGIYGAVGSPEAIEWRQKGATAIGDANEKLIVALNLAKNLTAESFEIGKIGVLKALSEAAGKLSTGNQNIDLVLQSVALLINNAVVLIEAFKASHLPVVIPEIRKWSLPEVNAWAS